MPGQDFYKDLSLADQVRKFSEHHHHPSTRHISTAESQILQKAAAAASTTARSDTGKHVLIALAAGGSAMVISRAVPSLRALGRKLNKKWRPGMAPDDPMTTASDSTDELPQD